MRAAMMVITLLALVMTVYQAQDTSNPCTADVISDPAANPEAAYQCGVYLQLAALDAAYEPSESGIKQLIDVVLRVAGLPEIIAATSVGPDTDAALEAVSSAFGDSFTGELLYNGLANGLDGIPLGCVGCHNGETAPLAEGTWTRVDEIRLLDPALADYTIERYLIESILHPNAYIVPDYMPNLMPDNYHTRLDVQQLADLVAYLSSQDQLIDEAAP